LLRDARNKVRVIGKTYSPGRMLAAHPDGLLLDLSAFTGLIRSDAHSVTFAGATPLEYIYCILT